MRDETNPFSWHGIERVSPSMVGSLQDDLAYGLMQAIPALRVPFKPRASMLRGRALDRGVTFAAFHHDASEDQVMAHADRVFDEEEGKELAKGFALDPAELNEERGNLHGYLKAAIPHVREWGVPEREQGKVELTIEGLGVPMIGYFDLLYRDAVRDLKTTERMPGEVSARYCKQLAPYAIGTGRAPWVDYCTPRELRSYRVEEVDKWMAEVSAVLFAFRRLLATSRDPFEVCSLVCPNYSNFVWGDEELRTAAYRIWGV